MEVNFREHPKIIDRAAFFKKKQREKQSASKFVAELISMYEEKGKAEMSNNMYSCRPFRVMLSLFGKKA